MATLNYRDPGTGLWVQLGGPTGPAGSAGPQGAPGPTVVSSDAGNVATRGSDGFPFVPGVDRAAMGTAFVDITGDTMTGQLTLPDQTVTPPSVPTTVAAKGYVDQVITASDVEPTGVTPARDGLVWIVMGEPASTPPTFDGYDSRSD